MMVVICIPLLVRWYMRLLWYLMIVMIARDRSLMIIMILLSIGPRCILTPINVVINATLVISIIGLTSGQCFVVKNKILCSDYHRSYRFGVMVVADEVVVVGVVGYVSE